MSPPANRAAWLPGRQQALTIAAAPMPEPGSHEIVVRNRAVAVNPFDRVVQTLGGMVTPWVRYPAVLGSDVAGEVVAVGSAVSRFEPGDRVLGLALGIDKLANRAAEGGFQEFVVVRSAAATPMPDAMTFESAAVLPLAVSTAACGLFLPGQLGLAPPSPVRPRMKRGAVLVWGGATSVGSCATQLAVAAGYDVVATSSPKNFDHARRLGASHVVDYRKPDAVDDIVRAFAGRPFAGALAIASGSAGPCIDIAGRCEGSKLVAIASAPVRVDDAPLTRQSGWKLRRLPRLAAGFAALTIRARVRGVRLTSIWGTALVAGPLGKALFEDYLGPALADGSFVAAPEPWVVGHSIEDLPLAVERLLGGVSARKIVVRL